MAEVTPINAAAAAYLVGDVALPGAPVIGADRPELARLLLLRKKSGVLTDADYGPAIEALGIGKRRIQQILRQARGEESLNSNRHRFELSDHHCSVIIACKGNIAMAYRQLEGAGEDLPHEDVFWRRWKEQLPARQAYARKGAEGFAEFALYLPYEAPYRNATWQGDHFELPIDVIADGHTTRLVKPWLTLFVDDRHRLDMAWALTAEVGARADAEVVCATIASGIRIRLIDGVEVGGRPAVIRVDNDLSFLAGMVEQLCNAVGSGLHAVPPYSGHMKGKVERLGKTVEDQFCVLQPGFTHGPKTWRNSDPFRDTPPLTADQLRARLGLWFAEYRTRQHSSLGMFPLASWASDATPLPRVSEDKLRSALLVDGMKRKVQKKGVFFRNQYWASAGVFKLVGRRVEVHYPVGEDLDFVELYAEGRWQCTAWPARRMTAAQRNAVFSSRDEAYAETRRLQDIATELRVGANAVAGTTDATPAVASMPAVDPIAANTDDLYDLLGGGLPDCAGEES